LLGEKLIVEQAEPWLALLSGILITLLGARLIWRLLRSGHGHGHSHARGHSHNHSHVRSQAPRATGAGEIAWFGFTGGLLPCPSAIAVLLICIQVKQFGLGIAMVAAFSVGLAITLVTIGVAASWGARKATASWPWLDRAAERLPLLSATIVLTVGVVMTAVGMNATGLLGSRKSN
jgi:nickel/cobalt exporter